VAGIIAHEIAHQWCGNAVSPKFWDSLWLNEGFATVLPYMAFEDLHPDWHYWNEFQQSELKTALLADDLASAHPIQQRVERDGEIEGLFDDISYAKSGCMIRMLLVKLGRDEFRRGMHAYFTEFLHRNADTADLCLCLSRTLNKDLAPFLTAWTTRNNYPIVVLDDDGRLRQRHFTRGRIIDDRWWPLPLVIAYGRGGEVREVTIELGEEPFQTETDCDWVRVNSGCQSLCRVWQQGRFFASLLDAVRARRLPPADRWAVLVDYRALAQAGAASSADVLALLASYPEEDDPLVLGEINAALHGLARLFPASRKQIAGIARTAIGGALARFGWDARPGEPSEVKPLRGALLSTLVFLVEDRDAIAFLQGLWGHFVEDRSAVDPNLLSVTFRAAARHCGAFEKLLALARTDDNPEVKSIASIALGYAPVDRLDEVLRIGLAAPLQDVVWYLVGVSINEESGRKMWDFVRENWAEIDKMFATMSFNIPQLIEYGTGVLKTEEDAAEVEQFFKEHPTDIALQPAQEAAEAIRNRAAVIARDTQAVAEFFAKLD
jgi:puromycin-sensitive aminopeptidase